MPVSRTGMTPISSYSCLFSSTLFCHSAEQIHNICYTETLRYQNK
ncbi:hypothetical protein WANA31_1038 [Wolbachia endosymbiont of Drosophila ananassae]|nr:hypothetical protein WANA31_1038 [Wolbachia endosymbiont of Drosophila ananassae]RLT60381.1 hypothetical protein WANA13_0419 [Wolbachia endosymbiont of Drosophila ananassae]RLT63204.1 hypothetical protein WANA34_1136 [Wolbachia endosymbiont of Drosophila ananassae]